MSDDLVKRLREAFVDFDDLNDAADRIEELEAACWRMKEERDRAIGWRDSDKDRADAAEAKLEKAVEALEFIAYYECVGDASRCGSKAALAELKGETNE